MRQIKFKVWDNKKREMLRNAFDGRANLHINGFGEMLWQFAYEIKPVDSDNFTLMQFTGLTDKKGVEIYEGDIVRGGKCDGQIEWDEDGYVVNPFPSNAFATQLRNENKLIEIIGNIYENPELSTNPPSQDGK